MVKSALAVVLCLALACGCPSALALSWPLCEDGGSVWVTERPSTDPQFPGANLWYFCDKGVNILGSPVDACVNNGTDCGERVADALCEFLGFDEAVHDFVTISPAPAGAPALALTGEYCLGKDNYTTQLPSGGGVSAAATAAGPPCDTIEKLACIRQRETLASSLASLNLTRLEAAAPAAETSAAPFPTVEGGVAIKASGGRRLKR